MFKLIFKNVTRERDRVQTFNVIGRREIHRRPVQTFNVIGRREIHRRPGKATIGISYNLFVSK